MRAGGKKKITRGLWSCLLLIILLLSSQNNSLLPSIVVQAKELVATKEWQRVGPEDTLPAGLEIEMNLSTGEKWARLLPDSNDDDVKAAPVPHHTRCGPSCKTRQEARRDRRQGLRGAAAAAASPLLSHDNDNVNNSHEKSTNVLNQPQDNSSRESARNDSSVLLLVLLLALALLLAGMVRYSLTAAATQKKKMAL